jgi:hypothetical protein
MKESDLSTMIKQLAEIERTCFLKRSRFAFYRYLEDVYECYGRLRRTKEAEKAARVVASLFDLPVKPTAHPIRGSDRSIIIGGQQNKESVDSGFALRLARAPEGPWLS